MCVCVCVCVRVCDARRGERGGGAKQKFARNGARTTPPKKANLDLAVKQHVVEKEKGSLLNLLLALLRHDALRDQHEGGVFWGKGGVTEGDPSCAKPTRHIFILKKPAKRTSRTKTRCGWARLFLMSHLERLAWISSSLRMFSLRSSPPSSPPPLPPASAAPPDAPVDVVAAGSSSPSSPTASAMASMLIGGGFDF